MTDLPNVVDSSTGRITITAPPPNHPGFTQNIQGGLIEASAAKTAASIAAQASHASALGATMRGSGRRFKFMRGGSKDANIPTLPEAGSIPGVSGDAVHLKLMDNLNQMKADGAYDSLSNSAPVKMGGFRLRGESQVETGGRKRRRKTKKNGRSKHRTHRRVSRRNAHRTRRRHHVHR